MGLEARPPARLVFSRVVHAASTGSVGTGMVVVSWRRRRMWIDGMVVVAEDRVVSGRRNGRERDSREKIGLAED